MLVSAKQTTQAVGVPAPVQGFVAHSPIYGSSPDNHMKAVWLYNMIPGQYGLRLRRGSREIAEDIPDDTGSAGEVRTVMRYSPRDGTSDTLFAATIDGIYDLGTGGSGPHTRAVEWPSKSGGAGWVSYTTFTNDAGTHYLLCCDEQNGYYLFDGTVWAAGTFSGSGSKPSPTDCVHVSVWQNRVFFVERDTGSVWYTDPGAILGEVTEINFGTRFRRGGYLVECTSWTLDSGEGMDDKFVVLSSKGDLLVYGGFDPDSAANWYLEGMWYVGAPPLGRRNMSIWGGDVLILTSLGIIPISSLRGNAPVSEDRYITKNISAFYRQLFAERKGLRGWQTQIDPQDAVAVFSIPPLSTDLRSEVLQLAFNLDTAAWTVYRNLDVVCMEDAPEGMCYGTRTGTILVRDGTVDNAVLDGSESESIKFSLLTHYSNMGSPANWKRGQFIRPSFIGDALPTFGVEIRYDFDIGELSTSPPFVSVPVASWDSAIWDIDVWPGAAQSYISTHGLRNMGRHIAIALRGETTADLALVGFDLMFDSGGML